MIGQTSLPDLIISYVGEELAGSECAHWDDAIRTGVARAYAVAIGKDYEMLEPVPSTDYQSTAYLFASGHGQRFVHFLRRFPGLYDEQFDPSSKRYRLTDFGKIVRRIVLRGRADDETSRS